MSWYTEWRKKRKQKINAKKNLKEAIRREYRLEVKEWFLFVSGLLIGILGGAIGNFFVAVYFRWIDNHVSLEGFVFALITFTILILFFLICMWMILRKMKKAYFELVENKGIR